MRGWLLGGMVGLSLLGLGSSGAEEPKGAPQQPARWLTDYAAARDLARRHGKPLCVVVRCEH